MKKLKKFSAILLTFIIVICSSGCSESYKDAYIYFELENKPLTLDPQLVSTRDETVIVRSIFDTLLRYNDNGELVPSACTSYEINGLTYRFKLSPDAYWKNGDKLTAEDFVFAFRRAVNPETKSPSSAMLLSIENAQDILQGNKSPDTLSVVAKSSDILEITLIKDDQDFLDTLTLPVSMPCNQKFFNETKGEYGLNIDSVLACGSYYIRKWTTGNNFLIRLAKNLDYKGYFEARSMRVYFTNGVRDNTELLLENDTDFSFLNTEQAEIADKNALTLSHIDDTIYLLFLSNSIDKEIRTALLKSLKNNKELYSDTFGVEYTDVILPGCIKSELESIKKFISYDIEYAQQIYSSAILNSDENTLSGVRVKCFKNPISTKVAKALVSHWQQKLGAFINIEEVSSRQTLEYDYKNNNFNLLIMPISARFCHINNYLTQFNNSTFSIETLQNSILNEYICYPLFSQYSYLCSTNEIINNKKIVSNGVPDIALAIKEE